MPMSWGVASSRCPAASSAAGHLGVGLGDPDRPGVDAGLVVGGGELVDRGDQHLGVLVEDRVEDRALRRAGNDRAEDAVPLPDAAARGLSEQLPERGLARADQRVSRRLGPSTLERDVMPSAMPSIATSTRSSPARRSLSSATMRLLSSSGSSTRPPLSVLSSRIRPPRRTRTRHLLEVLGVGLLVGVDEGEVELLLGRQGAAATRAPGRPGSRPGRRGRPARGAPAPWRRSRDRSRGRCSRPSGGSPRAIAIAP